MPRLPRRLLCLVLAALAFAPWPVAAQTAVSLVWDQPSPSNVIGYRVSLDGSWKDYGSTLVGAGGTCICSVPLSLSTGPHTLIVAAYNASGESASAPIQYTVVVTNSSLPGSPASPSPTNGSGSVSISPTLTWSSTGATSYDVSFGTSNPPVTVVASSLTAAEYQRVLIAGTTYFWKILARNSTGTTSGPVWSFTTSSDGAMPPPWTSQDIGNVGVTGSATYANSIFTVTGGGVDIWGAADAFRYVSQPLAGDGTIVARVTALQNTHVNAKAGVMMRGGLAAGARHVMLNAAVDGSIEFISRLADGTAATYLAGAVQGPPAWLKLSRVGTMVTGSVSNDGQVWSMVGTTSVDGLAYTGLVVTSADPAVANVSTFDSVTVTVPVSAVATLTSPINGATSADLTLPIQWTTIANTQAYYLYVGTTAGAKDLVNSGEIQQTSYLAKGVPGGQLVFARIHTKLGGVWRFNDSSFRTAAVTVPAVATLTAPVNGATSADLTLPIQWTTVANAQAYYLYVGTAAGAKDLVNTGEIQQTSYLAKGVPGGQLVFARIHTKLGGVWRFTDSSFRTSAVTVPVMAVLTSPVNGAASADLTLPIRWTTVANTQAYYLYVGTTPGAKDLVNSGEIQQTSYLAKGVPAGKLVYARIHTKIGGVWRFTDSSFTTAIAR